MNKKSCGWKIFFEVIFCSPKDSQLLTPWPSVKCISYIGKNPLQTKIKYVKIWNMFSFWWEGAKWTLARNNLSALWVGNCNCFILVFIMNMHPLLLLDNSQSKGSICVLQQFGYCQFCCCRFLEVFEIVFLIVHKKLVLEWFTINLELQVSRAQFSVPPLHWEQLNKYLNFQHDQEDFDFVCFLFTKRPNAGSSRLKEGSIAPVLSEGAHIPRWQT